MALRLLAGPFDIRPYGAPEDWKGNILIHAWVPGVGLLAGGDPGGWPSYSTSSGYLTLDGLYCDRSNEYLHECSWNSVKKRIVKFPLAPYGVDVYELTFEPIMLTAQRSGPEQWTYDEGHPLHGKRYVTLEDRSIFFENFAEHSLMGVVGTVETPEGPPLDFSFRNANVYPGRSNADLWIGERYQVGNNARGLFYNAATRQFSSPICHLGMNCHTVVYATDLGVLISGHNYSPEGYAGGDLDRNQLRIWSLEVEPTIISPVELVEGVVKSGHVATYRVKVTGAHEDAAEGELVNWTLTGAGVVLDPQSKTDAEGYAITRVQYTLSEIGSSVVEASLEC